MIESTLLGLSGGVPVFPTLIYTDAKCIVENGGKKGRRVCCDPRCSLPQGEWFIFWLSFRELSCPSISISSQWKEHAFRALGGSQWGDWGPSRKGDLPLVCGRLTSQHSRIEKKRELSETLSNNDFYKISKRGFILCKLNAELWLTGLLLQF